MANSPNMGLSILIPGSSSGPGWATSLEADKLTIDSHTHVSGQGLQVPTAGVNINATLPFNTYGASSVGTIGLTSQSTTASGTGSIFYNKSGNVYWNNASGVPIQLTTGNSINVASVGGITGLGGTTGAFTYSDALKAFIATADTAKSAAIDAGAYTVRETNVANAKGVTIKSVSSMANDYNLTLPRAVPTSSGLMMMDTGGGVGVAPVFIDSTSNKLSTRSSATAGYPVYMAVGQTYLAMASFTTVEKIVAGGKVGGDNSAAANFKIAGNTLAVGSTVRFKVAGQANCSNAGSGSTITLRAGANGTTADTSLLSLVAFTSGAGATNVPFSLEVVLTCSAIGAAATFGYTYALVTTTATGIHNATIATGFGACSGTFDSTGSTFLEMGMIGSATNTITIAVGSAELI